MDDSGNSQWGYTMNNDNPYSDPDANRYGSEQSNMYGNSPYSPYGDQPLSSSFGNFPNAKVNAYSPYRRRSRGRGCLVGVLVLLVVVGLGIGLFIYAFKTYNFALTPYTSNGSQAQVSNMVTFTVSTQPTIIINNSTGFVHIHAGKDATHVVAGVVNPQFDSSSPSFTQSNGGSVLTYNEGDISGDGLDLTVPQTTNLQIDSDNIEVIGVSGQMSLTAASGVIKVIESTLSGQSKLGSNGDPIFALEDSFNGQVTIDNNGGPITFSGVLAPNGKYTFDNNGGVIDITLPRNAVFHLDVTGIIDAFASDFPGIAGPDANSGEIHQDVGHAPSAVLSLSINGGPVILHQAAYGS